METKRCPKCGEIKDISNFQAKKRPCKDCLSLYRRSYYASHKHHELSNARIYRSINVEKVLRIYKIYRDTHKKETAKTQKIRYCKNKEIILAKAKASFNRDTHSIVSFFRSNGVNVHNIPCSLVDLKLKHLALLREIKKAKEAK